VIKHVFFITANIKITWSRRYYWSNTF